LMLHRGRAVRAGGDAERQRFELHPRC